MKEGGREGGRGGDVPARDEASQDGGANELHERAHPEDGHSTEHESHSEGNDGRHLSSHVGVVEGLGVQNEVLPSNDGGRKGGRESVYVCLSVDTYQYPFLPPSFQSSFRTLSLLMRGMPSLVKVSDINRDTSATGPIVSWPDVPNRE